MTLKFSFSCRIEKLKARRIRILLSDIGCQTQRDSFREGIIDKSLTYFKLYHKFNFREFILTDGRRGLSNFYLGDYFYIENYDEMISFHELYNDKELDVEEAVVSGREIKKKKRYNISE